MKEVQSAAAGSDIKGSGKSKVRKFLADKFDIRGCDAKQRAQCRQAARKAALEAGVSSGNVFQTQRHGQVRVCKNAWVDCAESKNPEDPDKALDVCAGEAQKAFEDVSGAGPKTWLSVQSKCKRLVQAALSGEDTVVKSLEQVSVTVITSDKECKEPTFEFVKDSVSQHCPKVQNKDCRVVDDKAEWGLDCPMTGAKDEQIEEAAAAINDLVSPSDGNRRLALRRLNPVVVDGGAAQTFVECVESDSTCGSNQGSAPTKPTNAASDPMMSLPLSLSLLAYFAHQC